MAKYTVAKNGFRSVIGKVNTEYHIYERRYLASINVNYDYLTFGNRLKSIMITEYDKFHSSFCRLIQKVQQRLLKENN